MKVFKYFSSLLTAFLFLMFFACSSSSSGDDGSSSSTPAVYSSTSLEAVSISTAAGKTFTCNLNSGVLIFIFNASGTGGTLTLSDGTSAGTFTYDGTVLIITPTSGATQTYHLDIANNIYYLTIHYLAKEDGSSGLYGKWVNATSNPLLQPYAKLYDNGTWTNATYESQGYSVMGTWTCNNGIINMKDLDGEPTIASDHIIYDGSRIYIAYTLTVS